MTEYSSAIALAKRLITKKGQSITLRGFTTAAPADPDEPWKPGANSPINQTVKGVFLNYEQKYIDGEMIRAEDQKLLIPSTTISGAAVTPPEQEGLVIRGSQTWKIVPPIKPLDFAGEVILYELQVRR